MRQILSRSLLTVAAASGVLAVAGGYASADSGAEGSAAGSPGVLSGNSVDIPVDAPVNACGNTVDAVGLLNPAFGNSCANGAAATGTPAPPPGAPQPVPHQAAPPRAHGMPPVSQQVTPTPDHHVLAQTGIGGREIGAAGATSAALLLGGAMLYRRAVRATARKR